LAVIVYDPSENAYALGIDAAGELQATITTGPTPPSMPPVVYDTSGNAYAISVLSTGNLFANPVSIQGNTLKIAVIILDSSGNSYSISVRTDGSLGADPVTTPTTGSGITLQNIADVLSTMIDIQPILSVGGYSNLTMLTIANDVMNEICAQSFPWPWNEIQLPLFYSNSWQQDYAIPGLMNLASLQRGIVVNINNNSVPKPWGYVQCVREQTMATSSWNGPCPYYNTFVFSANWMLNSNLYYGTWGDANTGNATFGNNPVAGSIYTNPLGATSQPDNPITQIIDANGNLLVLTRYGVEGTAAPIAPVYSQGGTVVSGTGATTQWTVVNPDGQGIRINPIPSQTGVVWQFNLTGQRKPVRFTGLSQSIFPLPDYMETTFRQGCTAQAYRYSQSAKVAAKFDKEWALWLRSLLLLRERSDKERDASRFVPKKSVLGAGGPRGGWKGPADPWLVGH